MSQYRVVCPAGAVPPGRGRLVEIDGRAIALFRAEDGFFATEDNCLHAGGPLHLGALEGRVVTCPWHGWRFDVATGACDLNPCVSLRTYPVRVRDGMVEIEA